MNTEKLRAEQSALVAVPMPGGGANGGEGALVNTTQQVVSRGDAVEARMAAKGGHAVRLVPQQ